MKLEYLYPEIGNLYGDSANMRYLRACLPEAEYLETPLGAEPQFVKDENVAFLYLGPMTERAQLLALSALAPYADALRKRIEGGMFGLFTGNAMELLGKSILTERDTVRGLELMDFTAKQDIAHRYNSLFLGEADGVKLTAFNSRFSHATPGAGLTPFAQVERGQGLNPDCGFEGYQYQNFIGTYLLGPLLVLNPLFTEKLLEKMGFPGRKPAFYDEAMEAYQIRVSEFEDQKRHLD